jgi:NAD(P)H-dependent FMN reductase
MTNTTIHTLINTFSPKGSDVGELLALQLEEMAELRETAAKTGWLGNEIYRATDGSKLVVVTRFSSQQAKECWAASPDFAAHLERISPLLERVESVSVDLAGAFRGVEEDTPLRLAVITGSTREGRFSDKPARWIADKAASYGGFEVTEIDLRDVDLPFLGDLRASEAQRQTAQTFGSHMAKFDAYLFTIAEYNHAPTAVLKNALDHGEWGRKPAGLVGYGGVGGARAVEHVRGIAAELELVTMQTAVHINFGDYLPVAKGEKQLFEFRHLEDSADKMLGQLLWWGRALRTARIVAEVG